jgi:ankyrin repeat protein
MPQLPENPHLDHLRGQAKDLLAAFRAADSDAIAELGGISSKPSLSHAQLAIARRYGFSSWNKLHDEVQRQTAMRDEAALHVLIYGEGFTSARPDLARQVLADRPRLAELEWVGLALGRVRPERLADLEAPLGPRKRTVLLLAVHSCFLREEETRLALEQAVHELIKAGANPNAVYFDPAYPSSPLTPLYGAAGCAANLELTRALLEAGANPNDNESVYHSCEHDSPELLELLFEFGAHWKGTNALDRLLDFGRPEMLKTALRLGAMEIFDEATLSQAIRRNCTPEIMQILLDAAEGRGVGHARLMAIMHGRLDLIDLLGGVQSDRERFLITAALGDYEAALAQRPEGWEPTPEEAVMLPHLASARQGKGALTLARLGWPLEAKAGFDASALNHAVFWGDVELVRGLLALGADWRSRHGYNDNCVGSLHFGSREIKAGDYRAVAEALAEAGADVNPEDY